MDAGFAAGFEEALNALVLERLDHGRSVARGATDDKTVFVWFEELSQKPPLLRGPLHRKRFDQFFHGELRWMAAVNDRLDDLRRQIRHP